MGTDFVLWVPWDGDIVQVFSYYHVPYTIIYYHVPYTILSYTIIYYRILSCGILSTKLCFLFNIFLTSHYLVMSYSLFLLFNHVLLTLFLLFNHVLFTLFLLFSHVLLIAIHSPATLLSYFTHSCYQVLHYIIIRYYIRRARLYYYIRRDRLYYY
jgi:hypothetical protein